MMAVSMAAGTPRTALIGGDRLVTGGRFPALAHRCCLFRLRCELGKSVQIDSGKLGCSASKNSFWRGMERLGEPEVCAKGGDTKLRIFSGTTNVPLSKEIASYLGLDLGNIKIKRFADGEIYIQLQESVRGCDVFLVQPTCAPTNENLMELLVMIDACRRASARTITAVIPYFGYARADKKTHGRESIAAKLVANLITEAGASRILTCDLHSGQAMGYFDIVVDQVHGQPVILDYLASKNISPEDLVVVSPDVGGVGRARSLAKKLSDAPLAIVDKRRQDHNVCEVMNLIGDVRGKVAVLVDDMIDTAGTITNAAILLHQEGANVVYACCTHPVFSFVSLANMAYKNTTIVFPSTRFFSNAKSSIEYLGASRMRKGSTEVGIYKSFSLTKTLGQAVCKMSDDKTIPKKNAHITSVLLYFCFCPSSICSKNFCPVYLLFNCVLNTIQPSGNRKAIWRPVSRSDHHKHNSSWGAQLFSTTDCTVCGQPSC